MAGKSVSEIVVDECVEIDMGEIVFKLMWLVFECVENKFNSVAACWHLN